MIHRCHATGCQAIVHPRFLMCKKHWAQVPQKHKHFVYKHYRPGQEDDKQATSEYIAAAQEAIKSIQPK